MSLPPAAAPSPDLSNSAEAQFAALIERERSALDPVIRAAGIRAD